MTRNDDRIAIAGTGPAALMAAEVLTRAGKSVHLYEKRKSPGRKLLVAGSSGLNISSSYALDEMRAHYKGANAAYWKQLFEKFSVQDWLRFVEDLGFKTFEGSGHKFFIKEMKAAGFLKKWVERLEQRGAVFHYGCEITDYHRNASGQFEMRSFETPVDGAFSAICFALGGGSYETEEKPLRWPQIFQSKGIAFAELKPSNVGYKVDWNEAFLKEAEGKPLKNVTLSSSKSSKQGELVVTRYGIEGTPVYFAAAVGENFLDLKPEWSEEEIYAKCMAVKENLSPLRRVKKKIPLSEAAMALLFHHLPKDITSDLRMLVRAIKKFPFQTTGTQPIDEAISTSGGICMEELDDGNMLKKEPGIFLAGEILDWDAPTGGFLIQACVSQGYAAGQAISFFLDSR